MRSCNVEPDLSAYLAGEMDPKEKAEAELHLRTCSECRARLRSLAALQSVLKESLGERASTPDLTDSVMMLLPSDRRQERRPRWAWALAGCALAGMVGLFVVRWTGTSQVDRAVVAGRPTLVSPAPTIAAQLSVKAPHHPTAEHRQGRRTSIATRVSVDNPGDQQRVQAQSTPGVVMAKVEAHPVPQISDRVEVGPSIPLQRPMDALTTPVERPMVRLRMDDGSMSGVRAQVGLSVLSPRIGTQEQYRQFMPSSWLTTGTAEEYARPYTLRPYALSGNGGHRTLLDIRAVGNDLTEPAPAQGSAALVGSVQPRGVLVASGASLSGDSDFRRVHPAGKDEIDRGPLAAVRNAHVVETRTDYSANGPSVRRTEEWIRLPNAWRRDSRSPDGASTSEIRYGRWHWSFEGKGHGYLIREYLDQATVDCNLDRFLAASYVNVGEGHTLAVRVHFGRGRFEGTEYPTKEITIPESGSLGRKVVTLFMDPSRGLLRAITEKEWAPGAGKLISESATEFEYNLTDMPDQLFTERQPDR